MPVARHLISLEGISQSAEFSGEECAAVPILQAGNWRKSHERTPVNCPTPDTELFLLPGMANRHGLIMAQRGRVKLSRCKNWQSHCRNRCSGVYGRCERRSDRHRAGGTASEKLLARLKNIGVNDWHRMPIRWWCGISLARKAIRCGDGFGSGTAVAGTTVESQ